MGWHGCLRSVKMLGSLVLTFFLGAAVLMPGQVFAQLETVSDNFNDNKQNKILWGPDDGYGNGVLKETNHRLEYTVSGGDAFTYRDLIASQGTYTGNWQVQIDVFNGTKTSGSKESSIGMEIFRCDNRDEYMVYGELYAASGSKTFFGEFWGPDPDYWDEVQTVDLAGNLPLKGSIRVSFDGTSKVITLDYKTTDSDWMQLGSFGISAAGGGSDYNIDWNMADSDQFCFDVYGWSEVLAIASGKIYADNFQASGVTAPVATRVLQPDGTEPVPASDPLYPVSWEAPLFATQFKLQYSLDNGTTWKPMAPDLVTGTSYLWQVPAKAKRKCLVKITSYDDQGAKIGTDVSAPFAIEVVKLDAPNGGEPLTSLDTFPITWTTSPYVVADHIQLFYTLDNGATWKPIDTSGDTSDDGSFDWTVARVGKTKNGKVKIVLKSGDKTLGSDVSDAPFTISPALP